jgi:hypothetical protein
MSNKESEIRKYLEEKVDPFLKPLLLDLMKNKPGEVYDHIKNWIDTKGKQINDNLHKKSDTETSHHYDNLKKSVASIKNLDAPQEGKQDGGDQPADPNHHTHADGTSHTHIGGDEPHDHTQSQAKVSQRELIEGEGQQEGSAPAPVKEGGFDPDNLPKSTTQIPEEQAKQESNREIPKSQSQLQQSQTQLAQTHDNQPTENQPQENQEREPAKPQEQATQDQPPQEQPVQEQPVQEAAPEGEAKPADNQVGEAPQEPKPEEAAEKPADQ